MKKLFVTVFVLLFSVILFADEKTMINKYDDDLVCVEKSDKAWLGVQVRDLDREYKKETETKANYGAVIDHILDDTPADEAGLKPGDVIVKLNNEKITDSNDVIEVIEQLKPGDMIECRVIRGKDSITKVIKLAARPRHKIRIFNDNIKDFYFGTGFMGMKVQELDDNLASYFNVSADAGLLVTHIEPGEAADKAGLHSGDILTKINNKKIENKKIFSKLLKDLKKGDSVDIEFIRTGKHMNATITLEDEPSFLLNDFNLDTSFYPRWRNRFQERFFDDMKSYHKNYQKYRDFYDQEFREKLDKEIENKLFQKELDMDKLKIEMEQLKSDVKNLKERIKKYEQ